MDTQTLLTGLRGLDPSQYEWSLYFYSATKSSDGVELDFGKCDMQDISGWIDTVKVHLLEKSLAERTVVEYSPFLPNEMIGALEGSHELMMEPINELLYGIGHALPASALDYLTGVRKSPVGYVFFGVTKDEEGNITDKVVIIRRSNPILRGKHRLCLDQDGQIITCDQPVLKLTPGADFLYLQGSCYFVTTSIEKDFGLEDRNTAICARRLSVIAEKSLVNNFEQLELVAMTRKHTRKFLDFEPEILEYIGRLEIADREEFLSEYGINIDNEGLIATDDPEQCELIIDLLCCRSCHDALGRLSVGSNIVPR